ncbi:MAG: hypothetical protein M4579_006185 [Chaenotheca gracillima]|nr:MAG: hypothetical protein M4579_006185 [Chaenotheca gracillima]
MASTHRTSLPTDITTKAYTTKDLATAPFLPQLRTLINDAYRHIHSLADPPLIPQRHDRVKVPQQICDELGPDGVMLIAFGREGPDVDPEPVACAGIKALQERGREAVKERFPNAVTAAAEAGQNGMARGGSSAGTSGPSSGTQTPSAPLADVPLMGERASAVPAEAKRNDQPHAPLTQWEVCMICSRPQSKFSGIGLPSTLLKKLEEEIVPGLLRMPSEAPDDAAGAGSAFAVDGLNGVNGVNVPKEGLLVICIVSELTGKFWGKRGYTFFWDETRGVGSWDAMRPFVLRWGGKIVRA